MGKEISKRCGGIPLVIRHIGRLLYGKTSAEDWEFIKENELLNVTREKNNNDGHVISTLKLSYNHLSPNLKQCFSYSSLFPKGYKIRMNELIRQWIAQGFIESSNGGKSVENIGKEYLDELCWRFFYEISIEDVPFEEVGMHDLMCDLAREVAGQKLYIRGYPESGYVVSEQTRHISFEYEPRSWIDDVSKLQQAKGLRTFLLFTKNPFFTRNPIEKVLLDRLFSHFPRLRVLQIPNVSKSIKKLRHLRYLELGEDAKSVPNSITKLQNLQTLDLTKCYDLKELPRDINNFVNLRHLLCDSRLMNMLQGTMEKLTSLQTLSSFLFDCKRFDKVKEFSERSYFIEFDLKIKGLEQLRFSPSDVKSVNLKNKKVPLLRLKWKFENGNEYEGDADDIVLEGLEPHPYVNLLQIEGYCGVGLPNWVSTSILLRGIRIGNCDRLHLNQLSHLHALEILNLEGLKSVMSISEWIGTLTSLVSLEIEECPKLKSLPKEMQQLKSLVQLNIIKCPQLGERCKEGGEDWPNISHIPDVLID
uniref:Uncharacterized protein n=2 Tax=Cucumis sativus TaxID=3659 RepID=A0A0A0K9P2_CUCSA